MSIATSGEAGIVAELSTKKTAQVSKPARGLLFNVPPSPATSTPNISIRCKILGTSTPYLRLVSGIVNAYEPRLPLLLHRQATPYPAPACGSSPLPVAPPKRHCSACFRTHIPHAPHATAGEALLPDHDRRIPPRLRHVAQARHRHANRHPVLTRVSQDKELAGRWPVAQGQGAQGDCKSRRRTPSA